MLLKLLLLQHGASQHPQQCHLGYRQPAQAVGGEWAANFLVIT